MNTTITNTWKTTPKIAAFSAVAATVINATIFAALAGLLIRLSA